ncbi:MAG: glycosyltransferase WbuB, partial [Burkholderiales bacterium 21-58-4]
MNILIVSQYFWPEGFRINDIARSLVERGCKVDVLTGKPNYPEGTIFPGYAAWGCAYEEWNGASLFRVPLFPRGVKGTWGLVANYLSFVLSGVVLGPWMLRHRKYDVVFVCGLSPILLAIPAVFIAAIRHLKLVLWVQDLWPDSLSATGHVRSPRILRAVASVVRWIYGH